MRNINGTTKKRGQVVLWRASAPLVGIGLTDLPKSGKGGWEGRLPPPSYGPVKFYYQSSFTTSKTTCMHIAYVLTYQKYCSYGLLMIGTNLYLAGKKPENLCFYQESNYHACFVRIRGVFPILFYHTPF